MTFFSRGEVENIGRTGLKVVTDERGTRGLQLGTFWLYTDPEDEGYTKHALNDGFWESWITLWMDHNVKRNSIVIDIGANHGYYSFFLAKFKGAKVFAFEPQPKLAELIRCSEEVNGVSVNLNQVAISDTEGETEMMVPIHHGMNATISNQYSYAPDGYEAISVPTWTLDNCFEYLPIDFIKVDAEGAEDLIWAGSKQFRNRNPECVWLMEWRWDRYKDPEGFAQELLNENRVSSVTYDGNEMMVMSVRQLAQQQHEDWMLVLRPK